jgi:hypothetical protein
MDSVIDDYLTSKVKGPVREQLKGQDVQLCCWKVTRYRHIEGLSPLVTHGRMDIKQQAAQG